MKHHLNSKDCDRYTNLATKIMKVQDIHNFVRVKALISCFLAADCKINCKTNCKKDCKRLTNHRIIFSSRIYFRNLCITTSKDFHCFKYFSCSYWQCSISMSIWNDMIKHYFVTQNQTYDLSEELSNCCSSQHT